MQRAGLLALIQRCGAHLLRGGITQACGAQCAGRRLAIGAALVVVAIDQPAHHAGLDDQHRPVSGQRDPAAMQIAAIEQQGAARFTRSNRHLVHDPAVDPGPIMLRRLCRQRQLAGSLPRSPESI